MGNCLKSRCHPKDGVSSHTAEGIHTQTRDRSPRRSSISEAASDSSGNAHSHSENEEKPDCQLPCYKGLNASYTMSISDLYRRVEEIIGCNELVKVRQAISRAHNMYENASLALKDQLSRMHLPVLSGSNAEGFRLSSSDIDGMACANGFKVIDAIPQDFPSDFRDNMITFVMDYRGTRPGYTLLKVQNNDDFNITELSFTALHKLVLQSACFPLLDGTYLSSHYFMNKLILPFAHNHGPALCSKLIKTDMDLVLCFECKTWPRHALVFVRRLLSTGWPSISVLEDILKRGFHVVPIGDKSSDNEHMEWRISCASVEVTLIHNMNHCQFLCYGLLKIFLKEAIDSCNEVNDLLCSYFLKTAIFWEICNTGLEWNMSSFFECFWSCFKRLIGWVYNEYCPNFIFPENNMFKSRIYGSSKQLLLKHLRSLYEEHYGCLLRCPSLERLSLTVVDLRSKHIYFKLEGSEQRQKINLFTQILQEILSFVFIRPLADNLLCPSALLIFPSCVQGWERELFKIANLYRLQYIIVQKLLQNVQDDDSVTYMSNKVLHGKLSNVKRFLTSCRVDAVTHHVLFAIYLCRLELYDQALKPLRAIRDHAQRPDIIHLNVSNVENVNSKVSFEGSGYLLKQMRKFVMLPFLIRRSVCVADLKLEIINIDPFQSGCALDINPLVLANFLSFICHHKMNNDREKAIVLEDLNNLLKSDSGYYLNLYEKLLTWDIIGICNEMLDHYDNALKAYSKALEMPFHDENAGEVSPLEFRYWAIKSVIKKRIQDVHSKMDISLD